MTPEEMAALHARVFTVPRPWTASEFRELLDSLHVFAVTRTGGLALLRAVGGEAELLTLAVAPDLRRRGLGRALLAEGEAAAVHRHAGRVFLEVAADNDAALALYRGAGYVRIGLRPGYYRGPDGRKTDALIFEKALSAA